MDDIQAPFKYWSGTEAGVHADPRIRVPTRRQGNTYGSRVATPPRLHRGEGVFRLAYVQIDRKGGGAGAGEGAGVGTRGR